MKNDNLEQETQQERIKSLEVELQQTKKEILEMKK